MSDHRVESGWWQASDGKWYPPAQQPPSSVLPPPNPPSPPADASPPSGTSRNLLLLLIGVGVIVALLLAAVLVTLLTRDDETQSQSVSTTLPESVSSVGPTDDTTPISSQAPAETDGGSIVGDSDIVGDVGPCTIVDSDTVLVDITNSSSKQSDFTITMNFFDAAGERVGDEPFYVSYVQPGQRTIEESYSFETENPDVASCEVAEVERFASTPSDDTSDVSCEVTGVDFADDIEIGLVVTNNGTDTADYSINVAIIRDDVRIGTGFGSVDNVTAGQRAPGDGYTFVAGPVDGATCEVANISRTASE